MSAPGFVAPELLEFAVEGGEPQITFWRETVGIPVGAVMHGEFPHAEMPADRSAWCMSDLYIRVPVGPEMGEQFALGCTRLREHDGQHVAHDRPGYPVGAWTTSQGSGVDDA